MGHIYGTSLPVGGKDTRCVLTSHAELPTATIFNNMVNVKKGDPLFIDVYGTVLQYEVRNIYTILPTESDKLHRYPNEDILTLFTCTSYGVNTHRLVIDGYRVPYNPKLDKPASTVTALEGLRDELKFMLAGALSLMGLSIYTLVRRDKNEEDDS